MFNCVSHLFLQYARTKYNDLVVVCAHCGRMEVRFQNEREECLADSRLYDSSDCNCVFHSGVGTVGDHFEPHCVRCYCGDCVSYFGD